MAMAETAPSFSSKLLIESMHSVVPAKVTRPGLQRRIAVSGPTPPDILQKHLHMVLYYKKSHVEEGGSLVAGWFKDSLSLALVEDPMYAGRLHRGEEGELVISSNDSGVRIVEAQIEATVPEFLKSEERGAAEAMLAFWKDVDEQNPRFSPLFYVQVTNFQDEGYSIGITCSLLLGDPIHLTTFIKKWAQIQSKILSENNIPKTPIFYFPNYRNTRSSPTLLTSTPCTTTTTRYRTTTYKLTNIDVADQSHVCKALASLFSVEAAEIIGGQAFSRLSFIIANRSGDWKIETYEKEKALFGPVTIHEGDLSLTSWDELRANELSFYRGNKPDFVSFWIESKEAEGVVLVMPPLEEGCLQTTISITVPTNICLYDFKNKGSSA